MGYPMTWDRLVKRNGLSGDYDGSGTHVATVAGDMRRLEQDSVDDCHAAEYAVAAGITPAQARAVLVEFFRANR